MELRSVEEAVLPFLEMEGAWRQVACDWDGWQ